MKNEAGKGDRARNVGPKFRENYDIIFRKHLLSKGIEESEAIKEVNKLMEIIKLQNDLQDSIDKYTKD